MRNKMRFPQDSTSHRTASVILMALLLGPSAACDPVKITDEELEIRESYKDSDGDGYYAGADGDDCNDSDASIHPGAGEICNEVDDNCDGEIDENVQSTFYADSDGDGFGADATLIMACDEPSEAYVPVGNDCDDGDAEIFPGSPEICDGQDNDCDGLVDDDDYIDDTTASTWYTDADGDGYGDPDSGQLHCEQPENAVSNDNDCDDSNIQSYSGAAEICDDEDNDCDGEIDEELDEWYSFHDNDGDGEGDPLDHYLGCSTPTNYVLEPFDCDDTEPGANTSAPSDAFIDSDGDGEDNCWEQSTYSFDAVWGEGDALDFLVDSGDDTYTPYDELDLCGFTDSPFGTADGDEDGLGVWSIDENGFIIEESNDACHGVGLEVGVMEGISIDVEYTFNDTGGGGIWVALETDGGYLVAALRYPYITTPPLGIFFFDTVTETVTEFAEDNHADFAVSSGVLSVSIYDDVLEATIGGASVTIDDAGEILSLGLTVSPNNVYVGSWDNDSALEIEAIGVTNAAGWVYDSGSGTYTR